jgi:hypothetical protein
MLPHAAFQHVSADAENIRSEFRLVIKERERLIWPARDVVPDSLRERVLREKAKPIYAVALSVVDHWHLSAVREAQLLYEVEPIAEELMLHVLPAADVVFKPSARSSAKRCVR